MALMRLALVLLIALAFGGCAARPPVATQPAAPVDVSARLAEADALVEAGCFDCLRDALSKYQAIRVVPGAPAAGIDQATAGGVRAAGLLAIRQRELGMVDDGYLSVAKALMAQRSCGPDACQAVAQVLDIVDLLPTRSAGIIMRVPGSDAEVERLQQYVKTRPAWLERLRDGAGEDPLTAYGWLAFVCGTSDGVRLTLDGILAPVAAMRDMPLLKFKQANCFGLDRAKLEAVVAGDPRFVEVWFLLGQYASAQRLLDEVDTWYGQAYAWHPRWPILTLSIGAVALTAEEFDRSLEFYLKTLELEPRAADALLGKARALTYLEQHEPAIVVADQLIGEGWLPGDAYYWKALNETQLGRLEAAWVDIEKADKLLINDQVPKLAGTIAYRRMELDVARAKYEEARRRNPNDCETGFFLGIVLADQRVWDRTAEIFVATARCLENAEQEYKRQIEEIKTSKATPARQAKQIARREQQTAAARRMMATSSFNTAVAYYNLSRKDEARQFAEKVAQDEQFGERAREILSFVK
jgi:tetratricopeptide (TPR) repeat protein